MAGDAYMGVVNFNYHDYPGRPGPYGSSALLDLPDARDVKWKIDLQLFAEEKTEPATPRKREEARRRGHVLRSREIAGAGSLIASLLILRVLVGGLKERAVELSTRIWGSLGSFELSEGVVFYLGKNLGYFLLITVLPLLAAGAGVSVFSNLLIGGLAFSPLQLSPSLSRLDPVAGLKRLVSVRSLVETFKSLLKLAGLSFVAYKWISKTVEISPSFLGMNLWDGFLLLADKLYGSMLQGGLIIGALAFLDLYHRKKEYESGLKMTKDELKEEIRRSEGQPEMKARQRERQRLVVRMRMISHVKKADVVIVNPEHYSAALKYEAGKMEAPVLLAKGKGAIAQRIKEEAYRHGIPVITDPPLARTLCATVDIGRPIPPELYKAVAEVLAYVYRTMNRLPEDH